MQDSITAGITFKCVADVVSASPFMCIQHPNDWPIQFNILTIKLAHLQVDETHITCCNC